MDFPFLLVPLFFLTALIYATAGFGGGSTYLALLALFGFAFRETPLIALTCNLVVVSGGTWLFWRAGVLRWNKVLPFVVTSIPAAYLGGRVPIGKAGFTLLLTVALGAAGLRLLISDRAFVVCQAPSPARLWGIGAPLGFLLGGLAGLTGIGGGIYLAPALYLLGWAEAKEVAACASFFILVNSVAGLAGQIGKTGLAVPWEVWLPLAAAVLIGGQLGSRLGVGILSKLVLQRVTAGLILLAAGRLAWGLL